jgi:carbon monoxide dehydrogenase subunit G
VSIQHLLDPSGDGTALRVVAEADPGKLLGLGAPLVRRAAARRARADFERLKAVLEAG